MRRTKRTLGVALAVSLWLAAAGPASAHVGHAGGQLVIEGVKPAEKGVQVSAVPGGIGKLKLTTTGATEVVVLGTGGQPMLRVGPNGVEGNAASPDWYRVNEPLGIAQVPATAKRGARDSWKPVSKLSQWEWFEHRLHPPGKPVYKWAVPIRVNGEPATIRGRIAGLGGAFTIEPDTKDLPLDVTVAGIPGPLPSLKVTGVGETPVDVLGLDGEVFARIRRQGTQVNVHSPVWVPTAQAANRDLLASVVDPSAKPEFVTASRAQDLIWPDPRILPRRLSAGDAEPGDKATWTLPIVVAGKRVTVRGTTVLAEVKPEFTPAPVESAEPVQTTPPADAAASATPKGGATAIVIGGIAAAVCVLAAGAIVIRRRRRAQA